MKNLIATLLVLISFNSFAQTEAVDVMLGTWASPSDTMILTISKSGNEIIFSDWDSLDGIVYEEEIIEITNNGIITTLHIPETGWNLRISYRIEDAILVAALTGSYEGNILYNKILN